MGFRVTRSLPTQAATNGAIEFSYVNDADRVISLKQWAKGEPLYRKAGDRWEKLLVAVSPGRWMCEDVQTWGAAHLQ